MKRSYRLLALWILIAIGVPALISFILYKSLSVEHGVRVHTGGRIWIEPDFDHALKRVWEEKIEDPIDVEAFVWIAPFEKRFLIYKGPPRIIYLEGSRSKDLSKRQWCMTAESLSPGLYNVLIRLKKIPPESALPEFFWAPSYVASENINTLRLFVNFQRNTVLLGLWVAGILAILARLNLVLAFLIPLTILIWRRMDPEIRKPGLVLSFLLLTMLFLRFYGFSYQLEEGIHPDERAVENVASHFRTGGLKPQNYFYTPGFHYMTAGVENVAAWVLGRNLPDHTGPRFLSAFFSWLSCLLVFSIGNKLFSRMFGVIACVLFGFAFLPVQLAHFGIIEPTMVFFFLLGFRAILNLNKESEAKDYLKAGLAAGLAVGIKQTAALICVPFIFMHLFANRMQSLRWRATKKILWWALGALVTYLLLSPYTLLEFPTFLHDQLFQLRFLSGETHTTLYFVEDPSGTLKILEYLGEGLGYPMLIAAAFGCILIWKRSLFAFITVVPLTLIFFYISTLVRAAPYHYPLLLYPYLALLAAVAVYEIANKVQFAEAFATILVVFLLVSPFLRIIKIERILSGVDTRRQASEWCYRHLPLGARIDYELFGPRLLIPVFRSLIIPLWTRGTLDQYMKIRLPEYVIVDSTTSNIFLKKSREAFPETHEWFSTLRHEGKMVKEFSGVSFGQYNPHIIIYKISKENVETPLK